MISRRMTTARNAPITIHITAATGNTSPPPPPPPSSPLGWGESKVERCEGINDKGDGIEGEEDEGEGDKGREEVNR